MFEERNMQFFCSDEQFAANEGETPPWNMTPLPEKEWEEFRVICETDADCPRPDLGQVCTEFYWDILIDGSSYANGVSCYNWEHPVCPGEDFSSINYNYENTGWSYYTQMRCKSGSGAAALTGAAAALLAVLNMF